MLRGSRAFIVHHIDPVHTVADHEMQHLHRHQRSQAAPSPAHAHSFTTNLSCRGIDTAGQHHPFAGTWLAAITATCVQASILAEV